jgi:UDP-N-acetylmuramoyl-tripeptide--D-alanyl-D-alanine ligase
MAELGHHSEPAHVEAGRVAAALKLDHVFAVGTMAKLVVSTAREHGLVEAQEFATVEEAMPVVVKLVRPGDVILVKASRASRLERLADALKGMERES